MIARSCRSHALMPILSRRAMAVILLHVVSNLAPAAPSLSGYPCRFTEQHWARTQGCDGAGPFLHFSRGSPSLSDSCMKGALIRDYGICGHAQFQNLHQNIANSQYTNTKRRLWGRSKEETNLNKVASTIPSTTWLRRVMAAAKSLIALAWPIQRVV